MKPPNKIDGAKILYWDYSARVPFGKMKIHNSEAFIDIHGLAIGRYDNGNKVYRFGCNKNWETEQDSHYNSIDEAMKNLPNQYKNVPVKWKEF